MNDLSEAPAIGSNQPPPETLIQGEALSQYLNLTYAEIIDRALDLIEKAPKYLVIATDEDDRNATQFLVQLRTCWTAAEAARQKEKHPYDDAAGVVHAFFKNTVLDPLGNPPPNKLPFNPVTRTDLGFGPRITMAMTIFKTAKEDAERKKREETARLAREAEDARRREAQRLEDEAREAERAAARKRSEAARKEADEQAAAARRRADEARAAEDAASAERAGAEKAAAAPAADLTRARGAIGGVSSLREYLEFRDVDRKALDYATLGPYFSDKDIDKAIRGYIDANKGTVQKAARNEAPSPVRGVVFYIAKKASGRA